MLRWGVWLRKGRIERIVMATAVHVATGDLAGRQSGEEISAGFWRKIRRGISALKTITIVAFLAFALYLPMLSRS